MTEQEMMKQLKIKALACGFADEAQIQNWIKENADSYRTSTADVSLSDTESAYKWLVESQTTEEEPSVGSDVIPNLGNRPSANVDQISAEQMTAILNNMTDRSAEAERKRMETKLEYMIFERPATADIFKGMTHSFTIADKEAVLKKLKDVESDIVTGSDDKIVKINGVDTTSKQRFDMLYKAVENNEPIEFKVNDEPTKLVGIGGKIATEATGATEQAMTLSDLLHFVVSDCHGILLADEGRPGARVTIYSAKPTKNSVDAKPVPTPRLRVTNRKETFNNKNFKVAMECDPSSGNVEYPVRSAITFSVYCPDGKGGYKTTKRNNVEVKQKRTFSLMAKVSAPKLVSVAGYEKFQCQDKVAVSQGKVMPEGEKLDALYSDNAKAAAFIAAQMAKNPVSSANNRWSDELKKLTEFKSSSDNAAGAVM